MDYRKIILDNWELFEPMFAYKKTGNKEAKTSWLNFINEKRNVVAHPSSAITISIEELSQLEEYRDWLMSKIQQTASLEEDFLEIQQSAL